MLSPKLHEAIHEMLREDAAVILRRRIEDHARLVFRAECARLTAEANTLIDRGYDPDEIVVCHTPDGARLVTVDFATVGTLTAVEPER